MTALLSRLSGCPAWVVRRELRNGLAASVAGLWCVGIVWAVVLFGKDL